MSKQVVSNSGKGSHQVKIVSPARSLKKYVARTGSVYDRIGFGKTVMAAEYPAQGTVENQRFWTIGHEHGHPVLPQNVESVPVYDPTFTLPVPHEPIPIRQIAPPSGVGPGLLTARFANQHGFFEDEKPLLKSDDVESAFKNSGIIILAACSMSASSKVTARLTNWPNISPEERILAELRSPNKACQFRAIIDASHTKFTDDQRPVLLDGLHKFIGPNLYTRVEDEITVVGSAARKYALNMDESRFEEYASWLQPKQTHYPHHRVELELVKGICWRLAYEPVRAKSKFVSLRETLSAIGQNYTTSRFLLQKNYAAIALNSIVSVFILDAISGQKASAKRIASRVREAGLGWFQKMVERRLITTAKSIREHDPSLSKQLLVLIDNFKLSGQR